MLKKIINHKVNKIISHRKKIQRPTFRALALRQSESENSSGRCYLGKEELHNGWKQGNGTIWLNKRNEKCSLFRWD